VQVAVSVDAVRFWNDSDGGKYQAAYFERFPGVWCHGDWVELTEHDGLVIYGRSDATLNPGGVRIGTAEIYRQVEQLPEIVESLVIGQDWPPGDVGDSRVVLFVRLQEGVTLDADLVERIKAQIRANTTPRHVPAKVVQVTDIPRTKSGKIVELAVRNVVHGRDVRNLEALANPRRWSSIGIVTSSGRENREILNHEGQHEGIQTRVTDVGLLRFVFFVVEVFWTWT
jgi:acetoacetyl-CoA synthetase